MNIPDTEHRATLDVLAHIVSQANVNAVDGDDGFIARYNMPVGSIHKAIPHLARYGISVDNYGGIHRQVQQVDAEEGAVMTHNEQDVERAFITWWPTNTASRVNALDARQIFIEGYRAGREEAPSREQIAQVLDPAAHDAELLRDYVLPYWNKTYPKTKDFQKRLKLRIAELERAATIAEGKP